MLMYPLASPMIPRNALFTITIIRSPLLPRTKQTQLLNKTQLPKIKHKIQLRIMTLLKIKANNQIKQTIAANNLIKQTAAASNLIKQTAAANNLIKQTTAAKIKLLKIKLNNKMKRAIAANTGTKAATTLSSTRETIQQTHHR